jgi:hypothetical protein
MSFIAHEGGSLYREFESRPLRHAVLNFAAKNLFEWQPLSADRPVRFDARTLVAQLPEGSAGTGTAAARP